MKTEMWNGYKIRFVEKDGEWWAVAMDVAKALGYKLATNMTRIIEDKDKGIHKVNITSGKAKSPDTQDMIIISEFGIYDAVFSSHKEEAKEFKRWVFGVIKELRESTGLEGFQIFRMLDKEHQKEAMKNLSKSLRNPVRVDFIKANTISNKAVSNKYGYPKMVKKSEMTPVMLVDREEILDDTVELMSANDKFGLGLSVSDKIYEKVRKTG
jgi:prophage antirepressor-like protein